MVVMVVVMLIVLVMVVVTMMIIVSVIAMIDSHNTIRTKESLFIVTITITRKFTAIIMLKIRIRAAN